MLASRQWLVTLLGLAIGVLLLSGGHGTFAWQPPAQSARPTIAPLQRNQVSEMVSAGVSSVDILVEAKLRGLAFIVGPAEIEDLTQRGADGLLLNWLGLYSLELQPKFTSALSELKRRRFARVIEVCDEVLQQSPHVLHVYLIRGGAQRQEGRLEQAEADFRKAIQLHPNSSRARVLLAETLIKRQQTAPAITELQWVVNHRSAAGIVDWPIAHRLLAAAYLNQKEYALAAAELHTALWQSSLVNPEPMALLPELEDHMSVLCRLLALCPDSTVASPVDAIELATLMKLMAQNPDQQRTALLRLAEAHAAAGQFDEAVATARAAEILGIESDKSLIRQQIELYRKQQVPYLAAGATSKTPPPEASPPTDVVQTLIANMVSLTPTTGDTSGKSAFLLNKYEVTRGEWAAIMGTTDRVSPRQPIEQISWEECQEFLKKLNERASASGLRFRLPTLTEWQFAVAENPRRLPRQAWFAEHGQARPHDVGTLAPNPRGLHDLYGNVAEWCADAVEAEGNAAGKNGAARTALRRVVGGGYASHASQCLDRRGTALPQQTAWRGVGLRLAAEPTQGRAETRPAVVEDNKPSPPQNRQGLSRAIEAARSAVEREPFERSWLQERLFALLYLQAGVRAHLQDHDTAASNLRTIIRESPQENAPLVQLARCQLAWVQALRPKPTPDHLMESRQIIEAALSRSEFRLWVAYLTHAALLTAEGKQDDAIRRINQATDLAPVEFKSLCTTQLESVRQHGRMASRDFPISPALDPGGLVTP